MKTGPPTREQTPRTHRDRRNVSLPGELPLTPLWSRESLDNVDANLFALRIQVYRGSDEILLSKLILDPTHSILKQSFDSRLRLVRFPPDRVAV